MTQNMLPTILIVDDAPNNLQVAMEALEAEGFRVVVAQDGDEGLQRADFVQPDLILLDVMMPGTGGFDICRLLKSNPRTREIPVIFMTALSATENKLSGFQAGCVDYVTKPLQLDELVIRVNTHLKLELMRRQLEEQNQYLHSYRNELEHMVSERTGELADANRKLREEIEERKRLQEALAAREREFRTLAEHAPNVIVRYDTACRHIYINPAYEQLMGVPRHEAMNKTPDEIWAPPISPQEYKNKLQQVMSSGVPNQIMLEWYGADDTLNCHLMYALPEYDEQDKVIGTLVIGHDISELRMAERRLEHSRAQLRELAARREEAREDERKHIARELHDELGQRLTALRLNLYSLRMRYCKDNDALLEHVRNMMKGVDSTIEMVRDVASRLRPASLDMGITPAIEWLAEDFTNRSGVACELHLGNEVPLDDNQATAVFRIIQESLTNIQRHAQASKVMISLEQTDKGHVLVIEDNGLGFNLDAQKKTFGLVGMEERVLMLDGALTVRTAPGQGVMVMVNIPPAKGVTV